MTTQTKPPPQSSSALNVSVHRFTVDEYYAMAEAGILAEDDRVELIDGVIVKMAPIGSTHIGSVNSSTRALTTTVGTRAIVQVQSPVRLDDATEPQPDLALLRDRADFYGSSIAGPEDVLLLIEVADSSVDYDRNEKLPRYAQAGIPEVWLAILPERVIEVHTEPVGGRYTQMRTFRPGDTISPGCFPDIALPVTEILPGQ